MTYCIATERSRTVQYWHDHAVHMARRNGNNRVSGVTSSQRYTRLRIERISGATGLKQHVSVK